MAPRRKRSETSETSTRTTKRKYTRRKKKVYKALVVCSKWCRKHKMRKLLESTTARKVVGAKDPEEVLKLAKGEEVVFFLARKAEDYETLVKLVTDDSGDWSLVSINSDGSYCGPEERAQEEKLFLIAAASAGMKVFLFNEITSLELASALPE